MTRRTALAALFTTAGALMTSACLPRAPLPDERSIGLGFEEVAAGPARWAVLGPRLAASGANAVSIAVGRVDWTGFAWAAHPEAAADEVEVTGRDLVAEAITEVQAHLGAAVGLTLVIDALAPRLLESAPHLAGIAVDGSRSDSFASLSALESGPVGERIVNLAAEVAARYRPDRLALTELMFDDHTFGDDDLGSYRSFSGATDWPRDAADEIDARHVSIGEWRSMALASLLARVREAVSPFEVGLEMDVRAPQGDVDGDRALSGHDYELLLGASDRLTVWNYFGLSGQQPATGGELAASLETRFPGRCLISVGLWAEDGTISADALATGLEAMAGAGGPGISVTPASLLGEEHWRVLERAWVRR